MVPIEYRNGKSWSKIVNAKKIPLFSFCLYLLAMILTLLLATYTVAGARYLGETSSSGSSQIEMNYDEVFKIANITAVEEHVRYLSDIMYKENNISPTRATGTQGNELAFQYIYDKFMEYGLEDLTVHEFPVAVPVNLGANITLSTQGTPQTYTLYPVLPNLVFASTTSKEGITGALIYVGDGYLEDFDGKKVEDCIVLLDWDTGSRWLNAVKLGAKAVVFLPPGDPARVITQYGSRLNTKYLPETPLKFPRFMVNGTDAEVLIKNVGGTVTIRSTVVWKEIVGKNLYGFVTGTAQPEIIYGVCSYYDSYSPAPDYAPGAEEAIGVAGLLEMARYFAEHPAKASMIFMAFGGHHQVQEGSRAFMNEYMMPWGRLPGGRPLDPEKKALGDRIWLVWNLMYTTGSRTIYRTMYPVPFGWGAKDHYANPDVFVKHLSTLTEEINRESGKEFEVLWDKNSGEAAPRVETYRQAWPTWAFPMEHSSLWALLYPASFTITTAYDNRPRFFTPVDTFSEISAEGWDNVKHQLEYSYALVLRFNEGDPLEQTNTVLSQYEHEFVLKGSISSYCHYGAVVGTVGKWSPDTLWYEPVPNALVAVLHKSQTMDMERAGSIRATELEFDRRFVFTNDNGEFETAGGYCGNTGGVYATAWVLDSSTGEPILGPDHGVHQYHPYPSLGVGAYLARVFDNLGWVAVESFSMVVLPDSVLPESLFLISETGAVVNPSMDVFAFEAHISPEHYGVVSDVATPLTDTIATTVFLVPSDINVELMMKKPGERFASAVLVNASEEHPLGIGYKFEPGQTIITHPILRYAENFRWLVYQRIKDMETVKPVEAQVWADYQGAVDKIEKAIESISKYEYSKAYTYSVEAWITMRKLYVNQRAGVEDSIVVAPYLAILLVPFTFLAERLFFKSEGIERLLATIGIFVAVMFGLYFSHPSFLLTSSPVMIIIGITTLLLLFPIMLVVIGKVSALITSLRIRFLGRHETEISRVEEMISAVLMGIENMRKRKLRSVLTIVSIIIIVASLVAFTSASGLSVITPQRLPLGSPTYQGLLIHREKWGQQLYGQELGQVTESYIRGKFPNTAVAFRSWRYTLFPFPARGHANYSNAGFKVKYNEKEIQPHSLVGLTPEEDLVTTISAGLIEGRWFMPEDKYTCILSNEQAVTLGVTDSPATIQVHGIDFKVVGIIDDDFLKALKDLDGEPVLPIEQNLDPALNSYIVHVTPYDTLILPYWTVRSLFGGSLASVGVRIEDASLIQDVAIDVFTVMPTINVYLCRDVGTGMVDVISTRSYVQVMGMEFQLVPIVIVFISILNLILANVHESTKDIFVLSSVGLSPLNIAFSFVGENLVYSTIACSLGFIAGSFMMNLTAPIVNIPLSYGASSLGFSVGTSMLACVIAAIYPAYTAARIVTPSLERAWKLPTSPAGDLWDLPFPVHASSEGDAKGMLAFTNEFLQTHTITDAPIFSARDISYDKGTSDGFQYMALNMTCQLRPYEMGISQESSIIVQRQSDGRWRFLMKSERKTGLTSSWVSQYRTFADEIRKQLLLWRMMSEEDQNRYLDMRLEEG